MAIKDLKVREGKVELIAEIIEIGDIREFEKFGKSGKVANAIIKDDTGTVKLSLWNEQIDQVRIGDKVKVQNGYVNEYQGELQLTTGKFGTLEVLERKDFSSDEGEHILTEDEKTEEDVLEEQSPATIDESVTEDEVYESQNREAGLTDADLSDFKKGDEIRESEITSDERTEQEVLEEEKPEKEPEKEDSSADDELYIEEEKI